MAYALLIAFMGCPIKTIGFVDTNLSLNSVIFPRYYAEKIYITMKDL